MRMLHHLPLPGRQVDQPVTHSDCKFEQLVDIADIVAFGVVFYSFGKTSYSPPVYKI